MKYGVNLSLFFANANPGSKPAVPSVDFYNNLLNQRLYDKNRVHNRYHRHSQRRDRETTVDIVERPR